MKPAHYAASSLLLVGTAAAGQSNVSIGKLRLRTPALSTAQVMPASGSAPITLGVLYRGASDIGSDGVANTFMITAQSPPGMWVLFSGQIDCRRVVVAMLEPAYGSGKARSRPSLFIRAGDDARAPQDL